MLRSRRTGRVCVRPLNLVVRRRSTRMPRATLTLVLATLACASTGARVATHSVTPAWATDFLKRWYASYNASDAWPRSSVRLRRAIWKHHWTDRHRIHPCRSTTRTLRSTAYGPRFENGYLPHPRPCCGEALVHRHAWCVSILRRAVLCRLF